ncbi:hypothetical protein DYB37_005285 [Aphanomyces astaci]|uniref:Uncharacterized protein n=1 Tax=Aphanomyces astaci TaxID=112090 RepID=A0A3R7AIU1_APHAT|nr:hypothetical protein DYB35_004914 [Aphanomyces astaci]RHZ16821.1 hypothetical protein DYB37_005285 [Aphanomyces astaci]
MMLSLILAVADVATSAPTTALPSRVSVQISTTVTEFATKIPVNIPQCQSKVWTLEGRAFDSIASCSSAVSTKVAVNAFRCKTYREYTFHNVWGCGQCYYGWSYSPSNNRQVLPWVDAAQAAAAGVAVKGYFLPQVVFSPFYMESCIMVYDKTMLSRCDYINRTAVGGLYPASCVKAATPTLAFAADLKDAASCKEYAVVGGKLACKVNI